MSAYLHPPTRLARQALVLKWRLPAPPSQSHWIKGIMSCLNLEKICRTTHGTESELNSLTNALLHYCHCGYYCYILLFVFHFAIELLIYCKKNTKQTPNKEQN